MLRSSSTSAMVGMAYLPVMRSDASRRLHLEACKHGPKCDSALFPPVSEPGPHPTLWRLEAQCVITRPCGDQQTQRIVIAAGARFRPQVRREEAAARSALGGARDGDARFRRSVLLPGGRCTPGISSPTRAYP